MNGAAARRYCLHWFSPLPPARTGIADYTAQIVPYLAKAIDVVLWSGQEHWNRDIERYASVRRFDPRTLRWQDIASASDVVNVPVYHLGNNGPLHRAIWEVSRDVPGVVVLHDTRLHDFFAYIFRDAYRDRGSYLSAMARYYGSEGRTAAERFWQGGFSAEHMAEHFPLVSLALENSLAAVVHSPEGLDLLAKENYGPASNLSLPYAATPLEPERRPGPPFRIVVSGYGGPNRRLDSFLRALAAFDRRDLFRVDIYGTVWDPPSIKTLIRDCGLSGICSLRGVVPLRQLEEGLRGAHLAVNLRFPTMGEASMSQLRLWDHGIPSLATPAGWYAHVPKDTVLYVRPEHEQTDIQRRLASVLDEPERVRAVGDNGRRALLAMHAPEKYVSLLLEFISRFPSFQARRAAGMAATRVGCDLGEWSPAECVDLVSRRAARTISELFSSPRRDHRRP